jgi:hypothetical protein
VLVDAEAVDSRHGLGGYHGSIHRGATTLYYAISVWSEIAHGIANGIVAFDAPWKNVTATLYHELCEARTDPDVEDAIRAGATAGSLRFLGWMSPNGNGEIGDGPINEMTDGDLDRSEVFREVTLADGSRAPIQLMWSNRRHAPA